MRNTLAVTGDLRKCKFPECGGKLRSNGLCAAHLKQQNRGQKLVPLGYSGLCAICGIDGPLRWDHDHSTGRERGYLCHNCNVGLGHFRDSPTLMLKAIAYLNKL